MSVEGGRAARDEGAAAAGLGSVGVEVAAWKSAASIWLTAREATPWRPFTSDDLVDAIGLPPVPNLLGATFLHWRRARRIHPVGYQQSSRTSAHARIIRVWQVLR